METHHVLHPMALARCLLFIALPLVAPALAQQGYRLPPPEVVSIIDKAPPPDVHISPDGAWMLLVGQAALPPIAEVSRPMLRLAGIRIDPAVDARFRTRFGRGLSLRTLDGGPATKIALPAKARIGSLRWSHDSQHFAYTLEGEGGSWLFAASTREPENPVFLTGRLSTVTGGFSWMPDGVTILCRLVPQGRGAEPAPPSVPRGPNAQETRGDSSPLRTYQDLLSNPHEEALFVHYATTQLAIINADTGIIQKVGEPGIFAGATHAPSGDRLLVTQIQRPFSYLMPWTLFPQTISVRRLDGQVEYLVAEVPLGENIPIDGVRTGPRMVTWKPGEPATLMWAEALDGGDPKREAEHRDRWLTIRAPFQGEAREWVRVEHRARGLSFTQNPTLVITSEYDRDRRWIRSLLHDLNALHSAPRILDDRSVRDRYADPGRPVTQSDDSGKRVVHLDGDWIHRIGSGATPDGLLPFLDRQNLLSLEKERLWRCAPGTYEQPVKVLWEEGKANASALLTKHETPSSPPNYRRWKLSAQTAHFLTDFADPTPQLRGIHQELVTYEREDGLPLSATLYLPTNHEPGTRLPLMVWAYPIEYNDQRTAGQVSSSPWRFNRISGLSHKVLLTQGFAIMDGAKMPVVGDPETMNDTFIEQVVAAAKAAIDKAVEMGVADPERVVVGGHSYGAFMAANLLAHSDLFVTGIARSGAYNRSLTPFGFQSERRTLWESPQTYFAVSPFMHAHQINEPLLLIHGEIDSNAGTYPLQSERLFQAIKGNGGTSRLVMLPFESHGYRARESVLHVHAETIEWLRRWCGPAGN